MSVYVIIHLENYVNLTVCTVCVCGCRWVCVRALLQNKKCHSPFEYYRNATWLHSAPPYHYCTTGIQVATANTGVVIKQINHSFLFHNNDYNPHNLMGVWIEKHLSSHTAGVASCCHINTLCLRFCKSAHFISIS